MTRSPDLTPAEFNVMKVLWHLRRANVADVRAELARRNNGAEQAYTTVMTLLGRLAAKGAVTVDRSREPFLYRAAYRRESVLRDRLRTFIADVFDGEADALVLRLVEDESLSVGELREIERRIDDKLAEAGPGDAADAGDVPGDDDADDPDAAPARRAGDVGAEDAR
ncbi:MAG: BlaI/MecI/CopY family transcriptional regulator [Myxococcales bacterium]|nr:BlaI/MecI/CopY family transcriptional regulator [Myxococcales bacterium]